MTKYFVALAAAAVVGPSVALAAPLPVTLYSTDFETNQSANWDADAPTGTGVGFGAVDYSSAFSNVDGRTGTALKVSVKTAASPLGSSHYSTTLDLASLGLS